MVYAKMDIRGREGGLLMARPRKYTKRQLKRAVEEYFDSITREVGLTEKVDTGRKDADGHKIFENKPVINKRGEQVKITEYLVPPTVGGLCEALEIHRSTWAEYCDEQLHPEFSDTTTRARGRMREYLEQQLLTRKDVKGVIFSLQNNYGYTERRELEFGPKASKSLLPASIPMSKRRELLKELAAEFDREETGLDEAAGEN